MANNMAKLTTEEILLREIKKVFHKMKSKIVNLRKSSINVRIIGEVSECSGSRGAA